MSEAVNGQSGAIMMSVRGVTKAFGSNAVLKGINMDVKAGEVIALIGGNGAGKSTLMKIIMGIYDLDEGEIFMAGQPVKLGKPSASLAQGIYLVPQEPMLFPNMTVLENVLMGFNETKRSSKSACRSTWRSWASPSICSARPAPCPSRSSSWWRFCAA